MRSNLHIAPVSVVVRPLDSADRHHIVGLFEDLDDRDRYFRFFRPMPAYPRSVIDLLTAMDGRDHVAVGAFDGETCIGVARYVRSARRPERAEIAVTVAAAHRGHGVAKQMIEALGHIADRNGIERFEINVHPENRGASALFRSLGFRTAFDDGTIVGSRAVRPVPDDLGLAA